MKRDGSVVKYIFVSRKAFFNEENKVEDCIRELYNKIKQTDMKLVLITKYGSVPRYRQILRDEFGENQVGIKSRGDVSKKFIEDYEFKYGVKNKDIVMIGAVKEDVYITANNKLVLFQSFWKKVDEEIEKYGFKINSIDKLLKCISILSLNKEFMYDEKISDNTTLIAITDAKSYYAVSNEKEMINRYKGVLKYKRTLYQYAVYFHYTCTILNDERFKDVDYWMAMPSSSGKNENYVYKMVENTRYIMKNSRKKEMFIRHTPAEKSTSMEHFDRIEQGCSRHFNTICLNPYYKNRLEGAKVCVLDDYTTNGTSFETIRNLLTEAGVSEIILVAIGTFQNPYIKSNYTFTGDIYSKHYQYVLNSEKRIYPATNDEAKRMIIDVYDIIKD